MENTVPINRTLLEKKYTESLPLLDKALSSMLANITSCLDAEGLSPTYKHRIKSFQSYFSKYIKFIRESKTNGAPPLPITDLLAIRVICPFVGDLAKTESILQKKFTVREIEHKGAEHSFREFGYESIHLLLEIPDTGIDVYGFINPPVCEVQIRTILQDAWAEVEHELVYKAEFTPFDDPMKRKLAALNANLTLSDMLFQEIRDYQHQLSNELAKRRVAFLRKIEDTVDGDIYQKNASSKANIPTEPVQPAWLASFRSIDDLLLEALNAHNLADHVRAIDIYTYIISLQPKSEIQVILYKHRGMAYFSESRYSEAASDFSKAIELNDRDYKALYYRAVVHSVQQNYMLAIDDFNSAINIHPYHFYSIYRRGQAYYHLADYPKALADCDAANELEPNNESVKKLREIVIKKLSM